MDASGAGVVVDTYVDRYGSPDVDDSQDLLRASVAREDGVQTLKFAKKVNTGDDKVKEKRAENWPSQATQRSVVVLRL